MPTATPTAGSPLQQHPITHDAAPFLGFVPARAAGVLLDHPQVFLQQRGRLVLLDAEWALERIQGIVFSGSGKRGGQPVARLWWVGEGDA